MSESKVISLTATRTGSSAPEGSAEAVSRLALPVFESGWVWLVGAGPGDPGLLTLHALNALQQADVVVYDALVDETVLQFAKPGAKLEYSGKRGGKPSPKQRDISARLVELARRGLRVLRLKGGIPLSLVAVARRRWHLLMPVFPSASCPASRPEWAALAMQAFPSPIAM